MRRRRHSLLQKMPKMPQPQQPKLKKTMANSKTWTGGVQRLQAPRQTKTQSPPKVKALRKQGQGERLEPAMRERPEEPAHSRKPRSSNRAGEEPRMRRRRHSLLQKMPQPQQPKLKKTMANSMRWTGGVQSLPAPRQTKTRSPPKAQALMGESSAERTLRSPSLGRAAEARHAYQWFYVLIWGRRDHEHPAGVQEDDQPGSPAHGQYNWYKNT